MVPDTKAKEWCEQAANGNTSAASDLVREFHQLIFAYLRRLTGNDSDAGDLCQVTFLKVWQSLPRFRGQSSVSTWIHRIAYCTYVDWLRKSHAPTEQTESWWEAIQAEGATPSEQASDVETARRVYAAVDRLPDDDRQIIHLHYYQGLSLAETAGTLAMPGSTLKYRLRGALEQLRSQLREPRANLNQKAPL